jgi:hypothetical protein
MSDPRTGGVTQEPRKTKENGVKNLKGAQSTSDFHIDSFFKKDSTTSSVFGKKDF